MKSNINDVAKHAGVSIKTVSRVINNEPSVRQSTRDKVLASAQALNYQPNSAARNLAATKSYTIAYIYDNPNAYYVIDMQNGILSECRKQGYELLIHPCNAKYEGIVDALVQMIRSAQLSGVVLTPPFSEMPTLIDALDENDIKYVRILSGSQLANDDNTRILVDDNKASTELTQHLIDLGHKDIAFIGGGKEHQSTFERLEGYKQALSDNNITIQESLILDGEYSFESGVEGAKQLLALDKPPTAIFSCNDEIAAGALFASRLLNVEIPQQLSIVGFENSPFSRQTWPKLTTANQPNVDIAQTATKLLISMTRNNPIDLPQKVFVPELINRDSSGEISA